MANDICAQGKRRLRYAAITSILVLFAPLGTQQPLHAQSWSDADTSSDSIAVAVDEARVISVGGGAKKVFVANPEIADVDASNGGRIVVYGRKRGTTTVLVTTRYGQETQYRVVVRRPLEQLADNISRLYPDSNLTIYDAPMGLTITGTIANAGDALRVRNIASQYINKDETLNFNVTIAGGAQVNLHVRIVEISRVASQTLGFNLGGLITSGSAQIGVLTGRPPLNITAGQPGPRATADGVFARSGSALSSIAARYASGGTSLAGVIDALQARNLLKVLAEPNLTAISGETADFLAGGEIPVPVASGNGDNQQVTIQWKDYGVGLKFTPVILDQDNLNIKVYSEVSELSEFGGTKLGGFSIPSITTRRVETTVQLRTGQSFAIAGLYNDQVARSIDQVPFLGNIPIIGELFRSRSFRKSNTELVIIVTPYIAKPVDAMSDIDMPAGALERTSKSRIPATVQDTNAPGTSDTTVDEAP